MKKAFTAILILLVLLAAFFVVRQLALPKYEYEGSELIVNGARYSPNRNYYTAEPGKRIGRCHWGAVCEVKGDEERAFLYIKEKPFCEKPKLFVRTDIDPEDSFLANVSSVSINSGSITDKAAISDLISLYRSKGKEIEVNDDCLYVMTFKSEKYPNVELNVSFYAGAHGYYLETEDGGWSRLILSGHI